MQTVIFAALGVGGATMIGAMIGFLFKNISKRFSDIVLAFTTGIMLAASVIGLVLPSIEQGGRFAVLITVVGIFAGAWCLNLLDKTVPHLQKMLCAGTNEGHGVSADKVLLFVAAIAIHNLPEGIAAGVGFGSESLTEAVLIASGIALQNIPEGMVIIAPLLAAGVSPKKTLFLSLATGLVEIFGTMLGYFAVSIANALLPFALSFAGGTMLYVISDEMIPETHAHGNQRASTYSLLIGFCLMLVCDVLLG